MKRLAEHQPVIDFPPLVDLEDNAAAYDDYPRNSGSPWKRVVRLEKSPAQLPLLG
jgi:hypothetical protein